MMMPRLKLLRELLAKNEAIFISIDDNEQHRLRMLCDEIFGEENFVADLIWKSKSGGANDSRFFAVDHEYILVYSKNLTEFNLSLDLNANVTTLYNLQDENGFYSLDRLDKQSLGYLKSLDFTITASDGKDYKVYHKDPSNKVARWRWGKKTVKERFNDLVFKNGFVYTKNYKKDGSIARSLLVEERFGRTRTGKTNLFNFFGREIFANPKPPQLIKHLLSIATNKTDIILDSFAGSGTTAHSVLDLNKEDGGKRKFILVECEDYADNITAERVRRVIKGVPTAKNEKLKNGLGRSFSYFDLGKLIKMKSILSGKRLPSYKELARYVFYTATGEEFDESKVNEKENFIGESKDYKIYLFYKPNIEYLKNTALTLNLAESLSQKGAKKLLVFAPTKYIDQENLTRLRIDFAQLPFEIYKMTE